MKVGDLVKITKRADFEWNYRWVSRMDASIGKIGKVKKIEADGVFVEFADGFPKFIYPHESLELVHHHVDFLE